MPLRISRALPVLLALFTGFHAQAASSATPTDTAQQLEDRRRCMEHTLGEGWAQRYEIDMVRSPWGTVEPSEQALAQGPQVIRMTDLQCRLQVRLSAAPRS